jgi:hypothetical protein
MALESQARSFAADVARYWARIYMLGLPEQFRERRQQELESDLCEHERDGFRQQASPAAVSLEIIGRVVRGMPSDLTWRLQLEAPPMELKIPFERITGILLLALVILIPVSSSISGYDTAREGWESELGRLGGLSDTQLQFNIFFQFACGLGLIAAAAGFFLALRSRARVLATFAAFGLTAAGVLTLATSATYAVVASLADEQLAGRGGQELLTTSRALALGMDRLAQSSMTLLALSVYALAYAAARHSLVPHWLGWLALGSAALIAVGFVANPIGGGDWPWLLLSSGLLLLVLWLVIAGSWLLLGRGVRLSPTEPAAA